MVFTDPKEVSIEASVHHLIECAFALHGLKGFIYYPMRNLCHFGLNNILFSQTYYKNGLHHSYVLCLHVLHLAQFPGWICYERKTSTKFCRNCQVHSISNQRDEDP